MHKQNCWEFKRCGREPCGDKITVFGVCPATTDTLVHGLNQGTNGGRICWAIPGTHCAHKVKGHLPEENTSCFYCDFFELVMKEEGNEELEFLTPCISHKYNSLVIGKRANK